MKKHLLYAKYILRHKWFVFWYCASKGLWWRGLMHDMSKMFPSEWGPYAEFFYGEFPCATCDGSGQVKERVGGFMKNQFPEGFCWVRCDACAGRGKVSRKQAMRDKTGYYKPTDTGDAAFDFSWLLHQKRNRHHWQWWVLPEDDGGVKVLPMQEPYRTEMICDWLGAGRALGTPSVNAWYKANGKKMQLHPDTRAWVEEQLKRLP
jgi:hypothetical protein